MKCALLLPLVALTYRSVADANCPQTCNGSSLNIVQCGAACDGSSDDTAAINCALDAVGGTSSGGEVIIPPGTCIISPKPDGQADAFLRLYSNLTVRGAGRKSILQVKNNNGDYGRIFSNAPQANPLTNVIIKDFTVDQNPNGQTCIPITERYVVAPFNDVHVLTVSGMFFDPTEAANTLLIVNKTNAGDLQATVTNNYFRFQKCTSSGWYDVSTVLMEGSQQVITNNTFTTTLADLATTAIETLGGRNVIANNTVVNYMTAVDLLPSYYTCPPPNDPQYPNCPNALDPTDSVVANNSVTCAMVGMIIWPTTGVTLRNASVTGNTIQVCNATRNTQYVIPNNTDYSGIETAYYVAGANKRGYGGDVDGLYINYNLITFEKENRAYSPDNGQYTAGIRLWQLGNLKNVLLKGNIIKDAPAGGIRVGAANVTHSAAQRLRIVDNLIVDAGNNSALDQTYRHAIGIFDEVHDADMSRNMIFDTQTTATPWGVYSLYLKQTSASVNVRTSQNTVRATTSGPSAVGLRSFQSPNGLADAAKDASNANDVLISTVTSASLAVDFTSVRQYLVTVSTGGGALTVSTPTAAASGAQWTAGQLVNFRFLCTVAPSCTVSFDPQYSTLGNLSIPNGRGQSISFQVEKWFDPTQPLAHYFFELYRSPANPISE